jgi:hypothetical protein
MRPSLVPAKSRWLLLGAIPLSLASCMEPQRPVHFVAPHKADDAVDVVARALASNGHEPSKIDRQTGIVYTRWEDTGFGYGFVQGQKATLVRRYLVTVSRGPSGVDVLLRSDQKRCQEGGYTIGDLEVRGACVVADGLVAKHQKQLEELGQALQAALGP